MLVELLVLCLILFIVFYLLIKFVIPAIPAPWGKIFLAVFTLIVVIILANRYLGLGL